MKVFFISASLSLFLPIIMTVGWGQSHIEHRQGKEFRGGAVLSCSLADASMRPNCSKNCYQSKGSSFWGSCGWVKVWTSPPPASAFSLSLKRPSQLYDALKNPLKHAEYFKLFPCQKPLHLKAEKVKVLKGPCICLSTTCHCVAGAVLTHDVTYTGFYFLNVHESALWKKSG